MTRTELPMAIRNVVVQVVTLADPSRIILFGSAARGDFHPDSDLDFLVVVPEGRDLRDTTDRLNLGVRARPMPCDFVVVTPSILRRHRRNPGLVYGQILEEGREVYAA